MRRHDREIKDRKEIIDIVKAGQICRLAMIDNGQPYIVPLNYGYSDGALYFHSAGSGRKIDVLKRSPEVCFEIDCGYELITGPMPCDWTAKYRSVIGYGRIEFVTDLEEKKRALDTIMQQHGSHDNKYKESQVKQVTIIKLEISEISGKQSK